MHGQVNNNKKPFIYSSWGVRHALKHTTIILARQYYQKFWQQPPHFRSSLLNYRSKGSNTLVFWLEAWLLWYIVALSPSTYVVKKNKKNHEVFFVYVFFFFRDERGDNQIMLSKNGIFCTSDDEKFLIFFYYLLYYRFLLFFFWRKVVGP